MVVPWLAVAWNGCYDESDYTADYYAAACELTFACYDADSLALLPYDDAEGCASFFSDGADDEIAGSGCTFDRGSAKGCIRELEELSCEAFQAAEYPDSCSTVCT